MATKKIHITSPQHISSAGFSAGVATALKAVKELNNEATIDDAEREIELLLAKANHNLNFNNAIVAHREGFDPQACRMRCRIDKEEHVLYLHITAPDRVDNREAAINQISKG